MATDQSANEEQQKCPTEATHETQVSLAKLLGDISSTFGEIDRQFLTLCDQTDTLTTLQPQTRSLPDEFKALEDELRQHHETQMKEMRELRENLDGLVSQQVAVEIKGDEFQKMVQEEIARQVKEQVDAQIAEHIPVSLADQATESQQQLKDIKISLENSEARMRNSNIQNNNLFDMLARLRTSTGDVSSLYPANLRSLFAYDIDSAQKLNIDYGLDTSEVLEMNLKLFLTHIGTRVELVIPEVVAEDVAA